MVRSPSVRDDNKGICISPFPLPPLLPSFFAQVLLDAGAEPSNEGPGRATALDMAELGGFEGVAEVLQKHTLRRGEAGAANKRALTAWLQALGCVEFLARFLTAGYDDLAFMASHGLTEADLDCIGVPHEKLGLRKKLLAMHAVREFLPNEDGGEEDQTGSVGRSSAEEDGSADGSSSSGSHDASDGASTAGDDIVSVESDSESAGSSNSNGSSD